MVLGIDRRLKELSEQDILAILSNTEKIQSSNRLNCRICRYDTCYEHAVANYHSFADEEMSLPFPSIKIVY